MKITARKIVFTLLFIIPLFLLFLPAPKVQAATQYVNTFDKYAKKVSDIFKKQEDPKVTIFSKEQTEMGTSDNLQNDIILKINGVPPQYQGSHFSPQQNKGAMGQVTNVMVALYDNPPASTYAYIQDVMANAGIIPVKKAYAQGIGFTGLMPLLSLWKASRNLAYGIIIIVMIIIGFMIIFRSKIDPKTVISIQAALPKIVLTLILITFSYPIAGFMIDMMYVVCGIVITLLAEAARSASGAYGTNIISWGGWGAQDITNSSLQQTEFFTGGLWKLASSVFNFGMIPAFIEQFFKGSTLNTLGLGGGGAIGTILLSVLALHNAALSAVLIGGVLLLIVVLGLLFTLIRLTMLLLNSYIQLLITVILGPLLLLQEAIPGQSAFAQWIQNIIANLVVFPATIAVIYFSWIVTAVAWQGRLWPAPLTPVGGGSDLGGGNPMAAFLGLGIIFLAPSLVASVKKAFHPKPVIPISAGTAFSPVTGAASTVMGAGSQFYYMQQMMNSLKGGQQHH